MKRQYFILLASTLLFSNTIFAQKLSTAEEKGILLMREEEKLAYDVYQVLYKKWELPVFNNISNSEARHIDAVGSLIDNFGLKDPIINQAGKFQNKELSDLYKTLTKKGSKSLLAALEVGAFIEEIDIQDLQDLIDQTSNETIQMVYGNLLRASGNHLRAFIRQLESRGATYTSIVLTKTAFLEVVQGGHQMGGCNNFASQQNNNPNGNRNRGKGKMQGQRGWN
jgi:hypothetical protein